MSDTPPRPTRGVGQVIDMLLRLYAILSLAFFLAAMLGLIFGWSIGGFAGMRLVALSTLNMMFCVYIIKLQREISNRRL